MQSRAMVPWSSGNDEPPANVRARVRDDVGRELDLLYPRAEGYIHGSERAPATWADGAQPGSIGDSTVFSVRKGAWFGVAVRVQHTDPNGAQDASGVEIVTWPAAPVRKAVPFLAALAGALLSFAVPIWAAPDAPIAVFSLWALVGFATGFAGAWAFAWLLAPLTRPGPEEHRALLALLVQSTFPDHRPNDAPPTPRVAPPAVPMQPLHAR